MTDTWVPQASTLTPLPQLVSATDPDFAAFQSDDPVWFLAAAGREVRKYVGWHIYPNIQQARSKIRTGARGIVMLPSRYVTQVESLSLQWSAHQPPQFVHPDEYIWKVAGYIQMRGWLYDAGFNWYGGYFGNDQDFYYPAGNQAYASVTFQSGYTELPDDVKEICFELAEQSMTARTGNVKLTEAPGGFRVQTSQDFGLTLNDDQRNRLAVYRIGMVG
jgi:hypothetical protein